MSDFHNGTLNGFRSFTDFSIRVATLFLEILLFLLICVRMGTIERKDGTVADVTHEIQFKIRVFLGSSLIG